MRDEDFTCPVCGEEVYANAKACPNCGADERSGWRDDAEEIDAASALGIDDPDEFNYDEFVRDEFGSGRRPRSGRETMWAWVAVILLVAFVAGYVILF